MSNTLERACWFGVHVRASESLKNHSSFHLEPLGSRPIVDTTTWGTPMTSADKIQSDTLPNPSHTSTTEKRAELRKMLRSKRQSLTPTAQDIAAKQLLNTFLTSPLFESVSLHCSALKIALYITNDGEISPAVLCDYFWSQKIRTYLPVVQNELLVFAHYHANSTWQENQFGIAEPIDIAPIDGLSLDMVFFPLVGFDSTGARLGMGGGFYDKTFSSKQEDSLPLLIGLAHSCQEIEVLPSESWDVPLNGILTDKTFIKIEN